MVVLQWSPKFCRCDLQSWLQLDWTDQFHKSGSGRWSATRTKCTDSQDKSFRERQGGRGSYGRICLRRSLSNLSAWLTVKRSILGCFFSFCGQGETGTKKAWLGTRWSCWPRSWWARRKRYEGEQWSLPSFAAPIALDRSCDAGIGHCESH